MSTIINADTSNGLKLTSDTSGEIALQSAGVTKAKITSSGLQNASGNPITSQAGKNRIINGNMAINQRGSASYDITGAVYTLDRYRGSASIASKFSIAPGTTTPPAGFTNYLQVTSSAATTPGSTDTYSFFQRVEGYNVADLNWGTSDAQTVTMSFWVRSTLTGTFGGKLQNSAQNRIYIFSYTISSANTWEKKTITIPGDTTGTWLTTNGVGLAINFSVGAGTGAEATAGSWGTDNVPMQPTGSTNVVATSGATWQITGLQLEVGTVATPFEQIQYGQQLQLCQRYFEKSVAQEISITAVNKTSWIIPIYASSAVNSQNYGNRQFAVIKRAAPTISIYPYTTPTNLGRVSTDGGTDFGANSGIANTTQDSGFSVANNSGGTLTTGAGQKMFIANWYATAEL